MKLSDNLADLELSDRLMVIAGYNGGEENTCVDGWDSMKTHQVLLRSLTTSDIHKHVVQASTRICVLSICRRDRIAN